MKKLYFNIHWSFLILGIFLILFNKGLIFLYYLIFGILHEMGHAYVGKKLGYKLNIISLMPYGASLSGNNSAIKPKDEILIAIAGPMINLLMILIICTLKSCNIDFYGQLQIILNVNISYFTFNLLPVFPLDGGRLLLALLNKKLKRKTAFKICIIIGWIVTIFYFVLFFASYFYHLNYMLGLNALFLLIGLFSDDKTAYYVNIKSLNMCVNKLQKGGPVKVFAFNQNANLFDAYKLLDKYNINEILIFNDENELVKSLMDFEFEKYLLTKPINTKLREII